MMPWMHTKEIEFVTSQLNPDDVMLEWGSGGSTTLFSVLVDRYYSIEHVKDWYNKVSDALKQYPLLDVNYNFISPDLPRYSATRYKEFQTYIEYPSTFKCTFDKVFIDGRSRAECAKFILPYLNKDSIVFIHDYYTRPQYHWVEEYYDILGGVDDTLQTIVGLTPKI